MNKFNFEWNKIPRTIEVLSRYDAEKEFTKQENSDAFVISISNPIEHNNSIQFTCANIRVKFDDIEDFDNDGVLISGEQAKLISESFMSHLNFGVTRFVVHCTAGISRSSGVALALMCGIQQFNTMSDMLTHRRFSFNKTCARKIIHSIEQFQSKNRFEKLEDALSLNYKIPFDLEGEFTIQELMDKFGS